MPLPRLLVSFQEKKKTKTKDKIMIWKKKKNSMRKNWQFLVFWYTYINLFIPLTINNELFLNTHKNTSNNYLCKQHTQF